MKSRGDGRGSTGDGPASALCAWAGQGIVKRRSSNVKRRGAGGTRRRSEVGWGITSDGNGVKGTRTRIDAQKAMVKVRSRKYEVRNARTTRRRAETKSKRGGRCTLER